MDTYDICEQLEIIGDFQRNFIQEKAAICAMLAPLNSRILKPCKRHSIKVKSR